MIKNKVHFQITGDLNADFGSVVSNPIIKLNVSTAGVVNSGNLNCDYNVYISAEAYNNGSYFFKLNKDGARVMSFEYPASESPFYAFAVGISATPPTENAIQSERKIIADTFGLDISNVELVEEV
jgi:hypothetical protein